MKPELYDDEYLNEILQKLYDRCYEADCECCPLNDLFEDDACPVDIAMELWRRNDNLTEEHAPGHWIRIQHGGVSAPECLTCRCSDCGNIIGCYTYSIPNYCSECGAFMREHERD